MLLYTDFLTREDQESAVRRYWRIIYKYRWIMLAAIGLCLAIAIAVSLLMKPEFTSTVTIQVLRQAPKVVDMRRSDTDQAGPIDPEFYQTQYALLKSRSLSERVAQDLSLNNNLLYLADDNDAYVSRLQDLPSSERLDRATTKLNRNTTVAPVPGSSIIDISYTSPDARLSAQIANSIAKNFVELNLARRFEAAAYARDFLQKQLGRVRARLEESERKSVQYAQQQGLIKIRAGSAENPTEQSLIASNLADLSSQLTLARAARAQAEGQYRAGETGSVAAQSLSSTTLNKLHQDRADLVGELGKLESNFGPEYPSVVGLRSQIAELDSQIAREQARVSSFVNQDLAGRYRQAVATEQSLQAKVDAAKAQLLGEEGRSIQATILQRDVDTNRALYDALLQQYKEVGVAGGVGTNNISIVDPAIPARFASSPNLALNLLLGLLIGLISGVAAALVLHQLAESVISPVEFQGKLGVPLLGSTPALQSPSPLKLITHADKHAGRKAALEGERSDLSEAYFSILTAVQFSTPEGAPRTMAVTSCQSREGKSTSALALARGLATLGCRVLLIDADIRDPSLHKTLEFGDRTGLSDLLTGHASFDDVIRDTDLAKLKVMAAGSMAPRPAELLASESFTRLVKTASESFDHVVFDSPPVLGLADAPLIAKAVDGVVFVIEADRTRSTQARNALERLRAVRAHILGAILTKLDSRSAGYGDAYGYDYRYGAA